MVKKLLLRTKFSSSKSFLRSNSDASAVLHLDPSSTAHGLPGRLAYSKGEHILNWKFFGALEPKSNPVRYLASVAALVESVSENVLIDAAPVLLDAASTELTRCLISILNPTEIVLDHRLSNHSAWKSMGTFVELEPADDEKVSRSIRKAQWFKLIQKSSSHKVSLNHVQWMGGRLGSGTMLSESDLENIGVDPSARIEVAGSTVLILTEAELSGGSVSKILDFTDCTKAQCVSPKQYSGLLCCLYDGDGGELGMGVIRSLSVAQEIVTILSPVPSPAPIKSIQLGNLLLDAKGTERRITQLFEL